MNKAIESKKHYIRGAIATVLLMLSPGLGAQVMDTVSLFDCHRSAISTHPFQVQKDLYLRSK